MSSLPVTGLHAEVIVAQHVVRAQIDGLTEAEVRAPSSLPDWTRGHVLAHLATFSQAFARQTRYALASKLIEVYDGGRPGRNAAIEALAGASAPDLVRAVNDGFAALEAGWAEAEPDDWSRPVTYRDGTLLGTLYCCWREFGIHAVDLDLGVTPANWSPEFCAHVIDFLQPRTPDGVQLTLAASDGDTWTYGTGAAVEVRGELTDLTAWFAGRAPRGPLESSTGALPELAPWP
ncbi:maleylpyruvate isomerase family mycothiol-dependent enzyme [Flindersiella endophytica]